MLQLIGNYNSFAFNSFLILFYLNFYISTTVFYYGGIGSALANAQTCHCGSQIMAVRSKIDYLLTEVDGIKTDIQNNGINQPNSGQTSNLELKHSEDVKKLEKKIEDLNTLVKSLEKVVTNLKTNMDSIITDNVQRQVSALRSALKGSIDDNSDNIKRIEQKTRETNVKLKDLADNDAQISSKLSAVETQIGKLRTSNHNQNLPVENKKKIENLETIVQSVKDDMQDEINAIQDQVNEFDPIPNKIKETEKKIVIVENKCNAISLSSNNLVNEINTLKLKIPADGIVSNVKLQEVVKRLETIENKPWSIENINKFLKKVKYTNWYNVQFTHRIYLEELYEGGEIKYKYNLVH